MASRAGWFRGPSLLLALLLLGTVLGLYKLSRSPLVNQYGILQDYLESNRPETESLATGTRSILLWSEFFGDPRWSLPGDTLGPPDFRDELKCPVYQCELTNNHDFLPSLDMYDAIVFHVAEPFPFLESLPSKRRAQQTYVFASMESPGETKHQLSNEQNFYNLTMTYRLDSDIVWPYGYLIDKETQAIVAPNRQPNWRKPPISGWNDTQVWNLWPGKTKMITWFVSHCPTLSKREDLAKALQEYIEVDVYGKCGQLSCKRGDPRCEEMLDTDYKFYLAFENSLCTDYVTEKLYGTLHHNIIPIVFGGVDYARFLPPHSYIDANQFDSVELLAAHLEFVASNVEEYMSYFWWREYYELATFSPFCELCEHLHRPGGRHRMQVYNDIEAWWFNSCRFKTHIQFAASQTRD
ncbi:alpha-(1,3)-fucosyltransferase C [Drosophila tropicalis]|uniref:alpha-(1,3)-fucosyltransferase C n=1 Tax=Drosophila tropicalis TaxID=46794 RepID=UPI0035AC1585